MKEMYEKNKAIQFHICLVFNTKLSLFNETVSYPCLVRVMPNLSSFYWKQDLSSKRPVTNSSGISVAKAQAPSHSASITCMWPVFFFKLIYFIFGCVGSSLLRAGFSLVVVSGGYSLLRCAGFSLRWLLLLQSTGSRCIGFSSCGLRTLELRLSSCGTRA